MRSKKRKENLTIYAMASGFGRCGIAVIRVSGPETGNAFRLLTKETVLPSPRLATLYHFYHPLTHQLLDVGLALYFPAPNSYTGEDVLELQLHGGVSIVRSTLDALAACPGLRLAERGEFTKRSVLNGQRDLTSAEAVADLINAETEAQRLQALRQMGGELADIYNGWRNSLLQALAYEEATIDFVDEDLGEGIPDQVLRIIRSVTKELHTHLQDARGEKIRNGLQVVIVGPPNVGKSSLLNALVKRDCAIVTEQAGTTRDMIEVHIDLNGLPVTLVDTAGLREATDVVEQEGIRRSLLRARNADLKLDLCEASALSGSGSPFGSPVDQQTIRVANKIDLCEASARKSTAFASVVKVSAKTGAGIGHLIDEIAKRLAQQISVASSPLMTNARHKEALQTALGHLQQALVDVTAPPELIAEELRLATRALGKITGAVDIEQVLDKIFSEFCIGK